MVSRFFLRRIDGRSEVSLDTSTWLILLGNIVLALVGGVFELRNTFFAPKVAASDVNIDTKGKS